MSQTHYCLIWTALQDSSSESWLSKNDSLALRQNVISKIQHLFHADIVITVVFSKGKQGKGIQLPFLWVVSYKTQTTGVAKGRERGRRKTNTELLSITKKKHLISVQTGWLANTNIWSDHEEAHLQRRWCIITNACLRKTLWKRNCCSTKTIAIRNTATKMHKRHPKEFLWTQWNTSKHFI